MSPKPVNVGRALKTLRQERPTAEAAEALLLTLHRPARRRRYARPLAFAMITTALALAIVLPPRTKAGSAWAETLANTIDAPASHSISKFPDGTVSGEEWREGDKRATLLFGKGGRLLMEMRGNGKRRLNLVDNRFWQEGPPAPNARTYGTVSKDWKMPAVFEYDYSSIDALLRTPGLKIVSHDEADPAKGTPERFRIRRDGPTAHVDFYAEVDATAHRIVGVFDLQGKSRTVIDYPNSIPSEVFEPKIQRAKDADLFDLDEQRTAIQQRIRKGLGRQGPLTLRLVTLDGFGSLWAFWTGALPDSKLTHPIRIPGVRSIQTASKKIFTAGWMPTANAKLVPNAAGSRIGGMSVVPQSKLGSTIDLDIPYPGGVARFKGVPVMRVGMLNSYENQLGSVVVYPPIKK